MHKRKNSPYFNKNSSYDEYIQSIKQYCCEKFREEAEKIITYVQSGKPVPDECYFNLHHLLLQLFDFNRPDDANE